MDWLFHAWEMQIEFEYLLVHESQF